MNKPKKRKYSLERFSFSRPDIMQIITEVYERGSIKFNGKKFSVYRSERGIFFPISQDKLLLQKVIWKRLLNIKERREGRNYAISFWEIREIFPSKGGYISNDIIFLWEPKRGRQDRAIKQVLGRIMELW